MIQSLFQEEKNTGMCMTVQFLRNRGETFVCTGYENGSLYFWDLRMNKILFEFCSAWKEPLLSCDFDQQHTVGFCGGATDELIKFNLSLTEATTQEIQRVKIPQVGTNQLSIRRDAKIVASAGWDHRIRVFQVKNFKPLVILKHHSAGVSSVIFSCVDNLMVSTGQDMKVVLWNLY
eukprot:TRINITY_DN11964_c1_g1_i7.p1 TRINITY_DN11964_c1_g1~~TRINITY_DN11964_c1_g1_i7.p1  ORF type:complete len:176 (+),score=29.53 TRINITY_DN11964_c1_g1_i7:456-983(+)